MKYKSFIVVFVKLPKNTSNKCAYFHTPKEITAVSRFPKKCTPAYVDLNLSEFIVKMQ